MTYEITDEAYNEIFEKVTDHFYRKYAKEWVDTLGESGNYLYHTVNKRIDVVLDSMTCEESFTQKVADAVWAMIEKEVDSDYEDYYLNAEDDEDEEEEG